MAQRRRRRLATGLAVTLMLALTPGAMAQGRAGKLPGTFRPGAGWETLWTRIIHRLGALGPESAPAAKCEHGSSIDPDGCPRPTAASPAGADHGLSIDPNG